MFLLWVDKFLPCHSQCASYILRHRTEKWCWIFRLVNANYYLWTLLSHCRASVSDFIISDLNCCVNSLHQILVKALLTTQVPEQLSSFKERRGTCISSCGRIHEAIIGLYTNIYKHEHIHTWTQYKALAEVKFHLDLAE